MVWSRLLRVSATWGRDDRLAYRLADGQALWFTPPTIEGWVHDIVQHPNGIIILPESPPPNYRL